MTDKPITQRNLVLTLAMVFAEAIKACSPSPSEAEEPLYAFANAIDDLGNSRSRPGKRASTQSASPVFCRILPIFPLTFPIYLDPL